MTSSDTRTRYLLHHLQIGEVDPVATARVINQAFARYEILADDRTSPADLLDEVGPSAEFLQLVDETGELKATAMVRAAFADDDGHSFADIERAFYFGLAGVADGVVGAGLGSALVRETEGLARSRCYTSVVLGTLREFNLPPYYERHGFATVATEEFPEGHWSMTVPHNYHEMQKMLTPTVRLASAEDTARVTEIVNSAYRAEDFFINGNRTDEGEIGDLISAGDVMVLESGDRTMAGTVYVQMREASGYFGMLSIDPPRQKTGWGRLLIDMAEQRARDAGLRAMDLQVVNLREELPPWYRRLGYVTNGTLPFPDPWKLRRPAHMVTMTKPLPAASEGREIWL